MAKVVQAGALRERVRILRFSEEAPGVWNWMDDGSSWAGVDPDSRKNLFSDNGIGTRGVILTMRHSRKVRAGGLLRWKEMALYLTEVFPLQDSPGYDSIRAAVVQLTACRAQLQTRKERDALNRPVAVELPPITFPGILTGEYHRSTDNELYRADLQRQVLVTPPEILLSPGDRVQVSGGPMYVIRTRVDMDICKKEYLMEQEVDV